MSESNQIVNFGNGIVDKAKSLEIDAKTFINLDTVNTAIRYKKMAPVVIANRLKTMIEYCTEDEEKKKLLGYIADLETAQQYGLDQGKCELIHWSSIQSNNTIHVSLGVYNLYLSNGKTVTDFVLISTTQRQTIDKKQATLGWVSAACVIGAFIPIIGPAIAAGLVGTALLSARNDIKNMTSKEQADLIMLKTLEHYGLVRLIGNNQIQLLNE